LPFLDPAEIVAPDLVDPLKSLLSTEVRVSGNRQIQAEAQADQRQHGHTVVRDQMKRQHEEPGPVRQQHRVKVDVFLQHDGEIPVGVDGPGDRCVRRGANG
jgi:hypothetical protein